MTSPMPNPDTNPHARREEELLVVRCQLGEAAAFSDLVRRFDARLSVYALRMVGAPIDDLRQDFWVRIIRSIPALQDHARLEHWIFAIARRAVMDHLRKRYREAPAAFPGPPPDERAAPLGESDLGEFTETLAGSIALLPPEERDAVTLFHILGRSIADVASVQAVPENTVKSRLARARARLAASLKGNAS